MRAKLRLRWPTTLEGLAAFALVVLGARTVAEPMQDNSLLTHLRTGWDILATWSIPRTDPYSFTAAGEPWVVQSWFASVLYGVLWQGFGAHAVILLQIALAAALSAILVSFVRSPSLLGTLGGGTPTIALGVVVWSQRPTLIGTLCFALFVWIFERDKPKWWLLPIGWIWVNSHGSYPLIFGWLFLRMLGEGFDLGRARWRHVVRAHARWVAWAAGAVAVGALNPLGPKLLTFWIVTLGERGKVFREIMEWGPPNFASSHGRTILFAIILAWVLSLQKRIPWRIALPFLVFLVATLLSVRYAAALSVVMAPFLASALRNLPPVGEASRRIVRGGTILVASVAVMVTAQVLASPAFTFKAYPAKAIREMDERGVLKDPERRVYSPLIVGNYRGLLYGDEARVFFDDRVDMYPVSVSRDALDLERNRGNPLEVFEKYNVTDALVEKEKAASIILGESSRWREVWSEKDWVWYEKVP